MKITDTTASCEAVVTKARFLALRDRAAAWLRGASAESGQFRYLYYPSRDEFPAGKNNTIRQLMASRSLAAMAARDRGLLTSHRKNLDHIFEHWYRERDSDAYILHRDKSRLGPTPWL